MPAEKIAEKQIPVTLHMGNVQMAAAFSGNSLVYRMGDVNYVSDPYRAFIADPSAMLGNEMATWLNSSGVFQSVIQPGSTQSAPYVLEATVTELYGDFRPDKPPTAVMAVQFALVDVISVRPRTVYEGTIERREPLEKAEPDALVQGYGKAVSQILTQFVSELSARKLSQSMRWPWLQRSDISRGMILNQPFANG
jgi:cholesterol transport system auxiliary component